MNNYITKKIIKELREKNGYTQLQLAQKLNVSDKTISKWETGKGLPDISLIEPLAQALGVSVIELIQGEYIENKNTCVNLNKSGFYVCPICGNITYSVGNNIISCCGVQLPVLEPEAPDENHEITVEKIENELFISVNHPMKKEHFISFIAYVQTDRVELVKLYPEGANSARFQNRGRGNIFAYCNKDGLYKI